MKLLLDTHIWLWGLLEPDRLSAPVREALTSPENEIWLSPISVWEAVMFVERGRLSVTLPAAEWVESMVQALPPARSSIHTRNCHRQSAIDAPASGPR